MTKTAHAELLADVLSRTEHAPNPRLREISEAAVRHLHAFVEEVGLQRDEWFAGIQFLTATGQQCDETRQEFILLSDTLGVSTLVEFVTHGGTEGSTENTVLGPFYVPGSPARARGESMLVDDDDGDRVVIRGTITDPDGKPIAGATLDCWQNATAGFYAVQQPGSPVAGEPARDLHDRRRRHLRDPHGPAGALPDPLRRAGGRDAPGQREGLDAARPHPHVGTRRGLKDLITHVFDEESEYLTEDAVFGVRPSLIRRFTADEDGELAATFDITLDYQLT